MQSRNPDAKTDKAREDGRVAFRDLSSGGKALFICKVLICIVTGGFVFPHVIEQGK